MELADVDRRRWISLMAMAIRQGDFVFRDWVNLIDYSRRTGTLEEASR